MRAASLAAAAALVSAAARAQNAAPPPPPAKLAAEKQPPLSKEDAELVKELALLERLEMVKNLELFVPDKDAPQKPQ